MASIPSGFATLPVGAKVGLLGLVLGVISAGYYFALHMPLSDEIDAAIAARGQLRADLAEAEQRQQEFLRITQELRSREAIDTANKRVLPENAEIPAFLRDLNRLAELSGLGISLVEPRPEVQAELYIQIPVTLALTGRFHQVAKFFYNISRLERAISMSDVRLREPTVRGEEVMLRIDVQASTYRRPTEDGQ
jgi:type IV pilus assembly protein PilO